MPKRNQGDQKNGKCRGNKKLLEGAIRRAFQRMGIPLSPKYPFNITEIYHTPDDSEDDIFDVLNEIAKEGRQIKENAESSEDKQKISKTKTLNKVDAILAYNQLRVDRKMTRKQAEAIIKLNARELTDIMAKRHEGKRDISEAFRLLDRAEKKLSMK